MRTSAMARENVARPARTAHYRSYKAKLLSIMACAILMAYASLLARMMQSVLLTMRERLGFELSAEKSKQHDIDAEKGEYVQMNCLNGRLRKIYLEL